MITIAVAGGTGGIGRTIVDELIRQTKYEVLIFSRTVRSPMMRKLDATDITPRHQQFPSLRLCRSSVQTTTI